MGQPKPSSSLVANLAVAFVSILVSAFLLGLVEGALRVAGIGGPDAAKTSRLRYQQIYFPTLERGRRGNGDAVWRTVDPRLPHQSILVDKPEGAIRVVTFGGSATAGLGYSPNVTFARNLERILEEAFPDHHVEVMNLGIVALASKQVKLLVAESCKDYDPDLVVVYSGNNEFLEVHAEKYAQADASWWMPVREWLVDTNLYRFVNTAVRGRPEAPSLAEQDFSRDDLRLTQDAIIQRVEMTAEEIEDVVDDYEDNLLSVVEGARSTGAPIILMTVASNWEWRGREDLPEGWVGELLGSEGPRTPERLRQAKAILGKQIEEGNVSEQHEALYRRALVNEWLGDPAAARFDYRKAMNVDPHLRRALDSMADRVRRIAQADDVQLLDTIAFLAENAENGIVGFDEFYDYVHFTPWGAILVAAELFRTMERIESIPASSGFDVDAYVARRLERLQELKTDSLDVRDWIGFGFDPSMIGDRDLWKYDVMLEGLDERIASNPEDVPALVFRANANSFRVRGAEDAARDYREALRLDPGNAAIRANLDRLLEERDL